MPRLQKATKPRSERRKENLKRQKKATKEAYLLRTEEFENSKKRFGSIRRIVAPLWTIYLPLISP